MLKWREIGADERKDWFQTRLCRDFPADEVKPFDQLEKLCAEGSYHCYLFYEQPEVPVGYACMMRMGRFTLLTIWQLNHRCAAADMAHRFFPSWWRCFPKAALC